jgi:hypothetical protein
VNWKLKYTGYGKKRIYRVYTMKRPDFVLLSGSKEWGWDIIIDKYPPGSKASLI